MVLDSKVGWSCTMGNKLFFFESDKSNKCKSVVDAFIKGICHYRELTTGKSWEDTCKRALEHEPTRRDIAYRLSKTEYEYRQIDETFDRYDSLAESVRQVLCRVYNVTELNDNIIDNLIKLVTNGIEDDKFVMYTAITYGKNVSEEEKMCLTKAIEEELDYTSIMNIGLGRVA